MSQELYKLLGEVNETLTYLEGHTVSLDELIKELKGVNAKLDEALTMRTANQEIEK